MMRRHPARPLAIVALLWLVSSCAGGMPKVPAKPDDVLARARQAGVETIIVTGTTVDESRQAARLGLPFTAGVHPHHARDFEARTVDALRELAKNPACVAIGECGLDFNRNYSPHPDQEKWFVAQIELGIELGKPLFLHSRDAHPRFFDI